METGGRGGPPGWDTAAAVSRENVEVVRRIYEAWLGGEDDAALELIDPAFELHPAEGTDWVGLEDLYRGHEGMRDYLALIYEVFDDYRAEVEDMLDAGDQVVSLAVEHARGKASGAAVEARHTAHVWTLRDGKAVRLELFWDRERALERAGLDARPS